MKCLFLAFLVLTIEAKGLPDPRKAEQLPREISEALAKHPRLRGVQVFIDGDLSKKILHVSPANRSTHATSLTLTPGPFRCDDLKDLYDLVYRVPEAGTELLTAREGTFSAFFDFHFADSVRHFQLIKKLLAEVAEASRSGAEHLAFEVEIAERQKEHRQALKEVREAKAKIEQWILLEKTGKVGSVKDEMTHVEEVIKRAKENEERAFQELKKVRASAPKNLPRPGAPDAATRARWIANDLEMIQNVTELQFGRLVRELLSYETTPVGVAEATLSLWGDEVEMVRSLAPGYEVVRLPISNIRWDYAPDFQLNRAGDATGTQLAGGWDSTKQITQLNDFKESTGSFRIPISRATYCMGRSSRPKIFSAQGLVEQQKVSYVGQAYEKLDSNGKANQIIALNYEFPIQAENIKVKCRLDWRQFSTVISEEGIPIYFFREAAWDNKTTDLVSKSGLSCELIDRPQTDQGGAESPEKILQRFSQEMLSEWILQNAESYQVWASDFPFLKSFSEKRAAIRSGSYASLCGGAPHCLISAPMLKQKAITYGERGHVSVRDYNQYGSLNQTGSALRELSISF